MEDECGDSSCGDEELDAESVVDTIVCVLVAVVDEMDGVGRRGEEEDLHNCVVESKCGVPGFGEEKVEVACAEYYHVEHLGFEGYACA